MEQGQWWPLQRHLWHILVTASLQEQTPHVSLQTTFSELMSETFQSDLSVSKNKNKKQQCF